MSWLRFSGFFLSALLLWTGWGAPVADCDFGRTGTPMKHDRRSENLGFFQGPLPSGCAENFTSWNRSSASTEPMTENGEAFLRFRVERVVADNEAPQFRIELPKLVSGRSYRLSRIATIRAFAHIRQQRIPAFGATGIAKLFANRLTPYSHAYVFIHRTARIHIRNSMFPHGIIR